MKPGPMSGDDAFWNPPLDPTLNGTANALMLALGTRDEAADLTIAIPTFRRPHLLPDTLRSVLAQTDLRGVRLIVVDNDPESRGHEALQSDLPELDRVDFRYYRNLENVGAFGNWNACIGAADTEWVSVLNDDDLLLPTFVAEMRAVLAGDPTIDALACSMREFDTRDGAGTIHADSRRERIKDLIRFGASDRKQLRPRALYFRNVGGSSLGLIARRSAFVAVGGYQCDEFPAADYLLNVRMAARFRFVMLKRVLTAVRIEENVSAKRDVILACLRQNQEIQDALTGRVVPGWWAGLSGPLRRLVVDEWNERWRTDIRTDEVVAATGRPLPERASKLWRLAEIMIRAV